MPDHPPSNDPADRLTTPKLTTEYIPAQNALGTIHWKWDKARYSSGTIGIQIFGYHLEGIEDGVAWENSMKYTLDREHHPDLMETQHPTWDWDWLKHGKNYSFRVRASAHGKKKNETIWSEWSNVTRVEVPADIKPREIIPQITDLTATYRTDSKQVQLEWSAKNIPTNYSLVQYNIQCKDHDDIWTNKNLMVLPKNDSNVPYASTVWSGKKTLLPGHSYDFSVIPICSYQGNNIWDEWSPPATIVIPSDSLFVNYTVPIAQHISATINSKKEIRLQLLQPSIGNMQGLAFISKYTIQYKLHDVDSWNPDHVWGDNFNPGELPEPGLYDDDWDAAVLEYGKTYDIRQKSQITNDTNKKDSKFSDWSSIVTLTLPDNNFIPKITDIELKYIKNIEKVQLDWKTPNIKDDVILKSYTVQCKLHSIINWKNAAEIKFNWDTHKHSKDMIGFDWTNTKLLPQHTYDFRALTSAINSKGNIFDSEWSDVFSISIPKPDSNLIGTIDNLKTSYNKDTKRVLLHWSRPTIPNGIRYTSYHIEAKFHSAKNYDNAYKSKINNISGLVNYNWFGQEWLPEHTYDFRVKTEGREDNTGNVIYGNWSDDSSIYIPDTTPIPPPQLPKITGLKSENKGTLDNPRLEMSWDPVVTSSRNEVQYRVTACDHGADWHDVDPVWLSDPDISHLIAASPLLVPGQQYDFQVSYTISGPNGFQQGPISDILTITYPNHVTPPPPQSVFISYDAIPPFTKNETIEIGVTFENKFSSKYPPQIKISGSNTMRWTSLNPIPGEPLEFLYPYTVQDGDGLSTISTRIFDTESNWIYPSNRDGTTGTFMVKNKKSFAVPTCVKCNSEKVLCISEQTYSNFRNGKPSSTRVLNNFSVFGCQECHMVSFIDLEKL